MFYIDNSSIPLVRGHILRHICYVKFCMIIRCSKPVSFLANIDLCRLDPRGMKKELINYFARHNIKVGDNYFNSLDEYARVD